MKQQSLIPLPTGYLPVMFFGSWGLRIMLKRSGIQYIVAFTVLQFCCAVPAIASIGDPQGSGAVVSAVQWLQGTLLGTVATVVAVIAIAAVGFMMLTGRINWRYGATVILGCFILFGAASIVGGIQSTAQMAQ